MQAKNGIYFRDNHIVCNQKKKRQP